MWEEFVALFSGYGVIPMIIMFAGVLLCIIEVFVPGIGIFGILGGIFSVGGIVARSIMGATVNQIIYMVLVSVSLVCLTIIFMIISTRCGFIKHSALVENKTSVSVDYGKDNKQLLKMLGKTTFATTEFKPTGKFNYNGETFEGTSYGEFISQGEKIQIVEIKADKIYVKVADGIASSSKK
ncbi:MAG: hypothetical protein MR288_03070 [Firmicutes bacterium]|nr:hypothetical protein [Bacillota bacterium]MDY5042079.1 hypothetical protein [Eubacteriales bacterium]